MSRDCTHQRDSKFEDTEPRRNTGLRGGAGGPRAKVRLVSGEEDAGTSHMGLWGPQYRLWSSFTVRKAMKNSK